MAVVVGDVERDVARQIVQFEGALAALKAERTYQIRKLIDAGFSEREVARAARLSGPRINQIKKEARCTTSAR